MTTLQEVCAEMDQLMLQIFVAYEDSMSLQKSFASSIDDGNYQLARARYIRGSAEMGSLMWPDLMAPSLTVSVTKSDQHEHAHTFAVHRGEPAPATTTAAEGIRRRNVNKQPDEANAEAEAAVPQVVDPIRWFGLQPPKPLRSAQSKFVKAVETGVDLAQLRMHITGLVDKYEELRAEKRLLLEANPSVEDSSEPQSTN
eukprot:TRINITY_DN45263_c0_g1_i1.p1 TRINITY_DN45263_c0_g1~~TRINITY_DN45263_c0_g1_i1.p1  ORF type:complete len:199 (-),score=33.38 TRINITY_DN45263_c0_g1_i1:239-835(-)